MTFPEFCRLYRITPDERWKLWRFLAFLRLEKMLRRIPK